MFEVETRIIARTIGAAFVIMSYGCSVSPTENADTGVERFEMDLTVAAPERAARDTTSVNSVDVEYASAARLYRICDYEPCRCLLDGVETSCALVESCLASGNCVLVYRRN
ncbi:MAG TPA: hypothetical protein VFQ61_35940 [Polyangiaceae bacterium]|nr:hypothetical protein [Polyangiaceae bacterium]